MSNGRPSRESPVTAYVGLGSNLGDREVCLREAASRIDELGLDIGRVSSIYETEPVGFGDQPWFLNQVIEINLIGECEMSPEDRDAVEWAKAFLSELLRIERAMGRTRNAINGPRLIDLDLLLFGDLSIGHPESGREPREAEKSEIVVPHPRMHRRRFVLEPLCEIAPDLEHPVLRTTFRELLARLDDPSRVRRYTR